MKFVYFTFFIFFALSQHLNALEVKTGEIKNKDIFGIRFPDSTSIYAKASTVCAISRQHYVAGAAEVHEISIDIMGSPTQVRIYHMRNYQVADIAQQAQNKADSIKVKGIVSEGVKTSLQKIDEKAANYAKIENIAKVYPSTTHSKTLEFIIPGFEEFESLYNRLQADFIGVVSEAVKKATPATDVPLGLAGKLYIIIKEESK